MCPSPENGTKNDEDGTSNSDKGADTAQPKGAYSEIAEEKSTIAHARRVSISVRALAVVTLIVISIAVAGVTTWLYIGAKSKYDDKVHQADNDKHAEQLALDYAVGAAIMDYKDLGPWKSNLVKGTTPELKEKLSKAAAEMEQILLPLQWSSTAAPLAAKVQSDTNGIYVVEAFVSVMTKTVQAADNLQSTATYNISIDSKNGWQISDVGGIAAVVGKK
jgi:Mce-associated membrane protein